MILREFFGIATNNDDFLNTKNQAFGKNQAQMNLNK